MKSQEQNQSKEATLYHSLGKNALKDLLHFLLKVHKKSTTKLIQEKKLYHSLGIDMP